MFSELDNYGEFMTKYDSSRGFIENILVNYFPTLILEDHLITDNLFKNFQNPSTGKYKKNLN